MPETVETAAPTTAPAVDAAPIIPRDPQGYARWRNGETPEPKTDAPAASSASGDEPGDKTAPASEAGKPKQAETRPPAARGKAETRLAELLADIKGTGYTPAELKTLRKEAAAAPPAKTDAPPASSAAPKEQPKEQPKAITAPTKPDFKNWTGTWDEREAAIEKWNDENAAYQAAKAVQDYRISEARAAMEKSTAAKVGEAQTRYGQHAGATIVETARALGFGTPEMAAAAQIPGPIQAIIDQSSVMVDLLYVLGEKPDELTAFIALAKSDPGAAIRKLVFLESGVIAELAKGAKSPAAGEPAAPAAERASDGKFLPAKPKASQAPAPAIEVGGHGAPPLDPVEATSRSASAPGAQPKEVTAFFRAANARDLARRQGR